MIVARATSPMKEGRLLSRPPGILDLAPIRGGSALPRPRIGNSSSHFGVVQVSPVATGLASEGSPTPDPEISTDWEPFDLGTGIAWGPRIL